MKKAAMSSQGPMKILLCSALLLSFSQSVFGYDIHRPYDQNSRIRRIGNIESTEDNDPHQDNYENSSSGVPKIRRLDNQPVQYVQAVRIPFHMSDNYSRNLRQRSLSLRKSSTGNDLNRRYDREHSHQRGEEYQIKNDLGNNDSRISNEDVIDNSRRLSRYRLQNRKISNEMRGVSRNDEYPTHTYKISPEITTFKPVVEYPMTTPKPVYSINQKLPEYQPDTSINRVKMSKRQMSRISSNQKDDNRSYPNVDADIIATGNKHSFAEKNDQHVELPKRKTLEIVSAHPKLLSSKRQIPTRLTKKNQKDSQSYHQSAREPIFQDPRTHPVEIMYYNALEDEIRGSKFLTDSVRLVSSDSFDDLVRTTLKNKNKMKKAQQLKPKANKYKPSKSTKKNNDGHIKKSYYDIQSPQKNNLTPRHLSRYNPKKDVLKDVSKKSTVTRSPIAVNKQSYDIKKLNEDTTRSQADHSKYLSSTLIRNKDKTFVVKPSKEDQHVYKPNVQWNNFYDSNEIGNYRDVYSEHIIGNHEHPDTHSSSYSDEYHHPHDFSNAKPAQGIDLKNLIRVKKPEQQDNKQENLSIDIKDNGKNISKPAQEHLLRARIPESKRIRSQFGTYFNGHDRSSTSDNKNKNTSGNYVGKSNIVQNSPFLKDSDIKDHLKPADLKFEKYEPTYSRNEFLDDDLYSYEYSEPHREPLEYHGDTHEVDFLDNLYIDENYNFNDHHITPAPEKKSQNPWNSHPIHHFMTNEDTGSDHTTVESKSSHIDREINLKDNREHIRDDFNDDYHDQRSEKSKPKYNFNVESTDKVDQVTYEFVDQYDDQGFYEFGHDNRKHGSIEPPPYLDTKYFVQPHENPSKEAEYYDYHEPSSPESINWSAGILASDFAEPNTDVKYNSPYRPRNHMLNDYSQVLDQSKKDFNKPNTLQTMYRDNYHQNSPGPIVIASYEYDPLEYSMPYYDYNPAHGIPGYQPIPISESLMENKKYDKFVDRNYHTKTVKKSEYVPPITLRDLAAAPSLFKAFANNTESSSSSDITITDSSEKVVRNFDDFQGSVKPDATFPKYGYNIDEFFQGFPSFGFFDTELEG